MTAREQMFAVRDLAEAIGATRVIVDTTDARYVRVEDRTTIELRACGRSVTVPDSALDEVAYVPSGLDLQTAGSYRERGE